MSLLVMMEVTVAVVTMAVTVVTVILIMHLPDGVTVQMK